MRFEATKRWSLIKEIVTHPAIYPHIGDDSSPPASGWEPDVENPRIYYIEVIDDSEVIGLFVFTEHSTYCFEVHTCLLPHAWGARAKQAAREVQGWIWEHSKCVRIITQVPAYNRHALAFAKAAGMTIYGTNPKCYRKNGKLHDVILLGISRPEVEKSHSQPLESSADSPQPA